MASVDLTFALEQAKYAARNVYGVIRTQTDNKELMRVLFKQMILQVLGDDSCLEELSTDEQIQLENILILQS